MNFVTYHHDYGDNSSVNYVFVANLTQYYDLRDYVVRTATTLLNVGLENGKTGNLLTYLVEHGIDSEDAQWFIDLAAEQKAFVEDLPTGLISPEEMLRIITLDISDFVMPEALPIAFVQDMMGFLRNSTLPDYMSIHLAEWQAQMAKRWPMKWMAWLINEVGIYVSPEPDMWKTLKC